MKTKRFRMADDYVEGRCKYLLEQLMGRGYSNADAAKGVAGVQSIAKQLFDQLETALSLSPGGLLTSQEKTVAYDACLLCVGNLVDKIVRESQVPAEEGDNP